MNWPLVHSPDSEPEEPEELELEPELEPDSELELEPELEELGSAAGAADWVGAGPLESDEAALGAN